MKLFSLPTGAAWLLALLVGAAQATAPAPLHTELTLTHVAADKWRADYVFSEPVTAIDLGPQVGQYRRQAWLPLTAGVTLSSGDDREALRSAAALTRLSVEISAFDAFAEGQYAPINRFSDGGWDFYLGFLYGTPRQGDRERSMDVTLHVQGLANETVAPPGKADAELSGYAYFGPGKPVRAGDLDLILDPQVPAWLIATLQDTSAKVSAFYERVFQRKLNYVPRVSVAMIGFDGPPGSFSIKGGALGGGIVFRLQGRALADDHPKKRLYVQALVAHEIAHLWQNSLARGGIGEDAPWIHEGGAEALMLAAMRDTGIYSEPAADQYAQRLLDECEKLQDDVTVYRGFYACGFKRFNGYAIKPVALWRAMMTRSEASGDTYSEAMIQALLKAGP